MSMKRRFSCVRYLVETGSKYLIPKTSNAANHYPQYTRLFCLLHTEIVLLILQTAPKYYQDKKYNQIQNTNLTYSSLSDQMTRFWRLDLQQK